MIITIEMGCKMKKEAIKNICGITVVLFIICITIFEVVDAISYSIAIATFLYILYEKILWRFDPFNKTPRIYGNYKTKIESTYNNGKNYESYITIKQTLSKITITEKMQDGVCVSIVASLYKYADDGQWFLCYTYLTHPKNNDDDMHYGTSVLYVKDKDTLEGFYYTNRVKQTKGKQIFNRM